MLTAAAVIPGPPAMVPELMGAAAHELTQLRRAACEALRSVCRELIDASKRRPGELVVVGPGVDRTFDAAGEVSFAQFGRQVCVPALTAGAEPAPPDLPTALMVARHVAHQSLRGDRSAPTPDETARRLWAGATWRTVSAAAAAELGSHIRHAPQAIGLVLVADGAPGHGPKAPRAEDSRAWKVDEAVWQALESGDPQRLAAHDHQLAALLGATGPAVWPVLINAAAGSRWHGAVTWRGAPYGVGWQVALWRADRAAAAQGTGTSCAQSTGSADRARSGDPAASDA